MKVKPLLEAVSMILPAVDSKGLVQEFSLLHFKDKRVQATDGSLLIRADLEEEVPEFTIGAKVFHSLLRTIKDKEVEITIADNKAYLKTKKLKTELTLPGEKIETNVDFDVSEWEDIPEGFIKGLELCRYTACPDQTAGSLTGVRVEGASIISTDKYRISTYTLGEKLSAAMTLPVSLVDQLSRFSKYLESYAVKDSTIYFNLGSGIIGAQLLPGEYPTETLFQGIDMLEKAIKLDISDGLKDSISEAGKRQNIIQDSMLEFDRWTKFSVKEGNITLYAENKEVGLIEESLGVTGAEGETCPDFEFHINPVFLLKTFEDTDTLLYAEDNAIAAFEGDNFIHLVKTKQPDTEE